MFFHKAHSPDKLTLFVCKANVGRSQIAEGLYNAKFGRSSISLAGCQARKEKYGGRSLEELADIVKNGSNIDISKQRIKYLKDIPASMIRKISKVYYLYDPISEDSCDEDCKFQGLTPYNYFLGTNTPITIYPIPDPFDTGETEYITIYEKIVEFISHIKVY